MQYQFYRPPALLQEDLLYYVFEHICHPHVLAHAAVVCRAWTTPAQAALYRELEYAPLARSSKEALLARTMRTRPHLLRFVRRLSLVTVWTHSPIPELCEWIKHIPADLLQDFRWTWERGHPLPSLLDSPAMRGTRHVELRGSLYSMESIQSILDLPYLESLSLELKGDERGYLLGMTSKRLSHLRIVAHRGHSPALDILLSTVGPQLESLHITGKLGEDPEQDAALVSCIATHCPDLTRLAIEATASSGKSVTVANDLARRCRSLHTLRCGEGTFTSGIFRDVPPTLRVLRLPLDPSLEASLLSYLRGLRGGLTVLQLSGKGDSERFKAVAEACCAHGVVLELLYD
ncbi:hypothetical protein C8Q77DRAFT_74874 [Trametes polyzona]|nr:hypothetical protein C8Q77DRAFT_74874 [Trametes polyzona]